MGELTCLLRAVQLRSEPINLNRLRARADEWTADHVVTSVAALAADAEAHSRRHGFRSTPRPEAGFAASPAWADPGVVRRTMAALYTATRELVWGSFPTL